ncbi:hypothetical protein D3C83_324190 [compost metagenome]
MVVAFFEHGENAGRAVDRHLYVGQRIEQPDGWRLRKLFRLGDDGERLGNFAAVE